MAHNPSLEQLVRHDLIRDLVFAQSGNGLDVIERQTEREGQGIGLGDADLGAVEPSIGGEGASAPFPVLSEGRDNEDHQEQDH